MTSPNASAFQKPTQMSPGVEEGLDLPEVGPGRHAEELHRHEIAAVDADDVEHPGEEGEGDEPRHQRRHDEVPHRVQRHHGERVDLLGDAHDADLGRQRRSRAPGHHERGEHRAELTHERDRHQRTHEGLGADALEHQHALEPEDHPGERAGQEDHGQRAEAHEPDPLERLAGLERRDDGPPERPRPERRRNARGRRGCRGRSARDPGGSRERGNRAFGAGRVWAGLPPGSTA